MSPAFFERRQFCFHLYVPNCLFVLCLSGFLVIVACLFMFASTPICACNLHEEQHRHQVRRAGPSYRSQHQAVFSLVAAGLAASAEQAQPQAVSSDTAVQAIFPLLAKFAVQATLFS